MTSLSMDITVVNPAYKNLPKEGDLFEVTQVIKSKDSIFGERVTVIFKSTTKQKVVEGVALDEVTQKMRADFELVELKYPVEGEE